MSEQIKKIRFETDIARDFFAKNLAYTLGPVELKDMIEENKIRLIDVRAEEDYKISHIPNSINLPYGRRFGKWSNRTFKRRYKCCLLLQ